MKKFILMALLFNSSSSMAFYPNNYEESRAHFLDLAKELKIKYPRLKQSSLEIPTTTSAQLTTDTIYISQRDSKKDRIFILTSGIHGVEAFTGSAIQSQFIKTQLNDALLKNMAVLIVHAVNPYGFHFKRRVSENNVDLNRNFSAQQTHFSGQNKAYSKLKTFLNPLDSLNSTLYSDFKLFLRSLTLLAQYGKKSLTQAVVGGQYQYKKAIYFGGSQLEPNVEILKNEFLKRARSYKSIFHIDLHTGYGERGKLHYFINNSILEKSPFLKDLFAGYELDTGDKSDFYETTGDFANFSINTFPNSTVIPMVFEFGTMDSQNIIGSFQSLRNMIYENQGFQFGYVSEKSKLRTETQFLEMFNPTDEKWRNKVLKTSHTELNKLLERFGNLTI